LKQCLEFIDSLNARTGLHFRMPTEAEWEYAARGGHRSKGFLYSGSDDMSDVAHINYGVVAKLRPNELGIYDMSGNMAEMTLDYLVDHETGYPSAEAQVNPRRISSSGNRAVRGLKRFSSYVNLRISHRSAYTPSWCGSGMGFRLVLPEERDFHTIYVNGVFFDMAFVEGGTFMMGDNSSDNASPAHQVTLSDYYIGQTEVTQALWTAVMGTNPSKFRGNNLPVECVSWEDCQLFVQKLSDMTGLHFRLPTEAEWEFAARGGVKSRGYKYVGSDDVDSVAWYGVNSGQKTHSIAGKKPNELGIYDMSGNVWEWCQDWHEPYTAESQENPQGASEGEKPVIRGGCWHYNPIQCTPTYRYSYYDRTGSGASTGFRIVLDIK
jgi:formylglycine-generating enzyme required for sulfatase activity